MTRLSTWSVRLLFLSCLLLSLPACSKRTPPLAAAPQPAPAPARDETPPLSVPSPTVEIGSSPSTIQRGQSTTLMWRSTNASALVIDSGVGNVQESGSLEVSPLESTTYTATANGPGGETRASTRVTVVAATDAVIETADIDALQRAIDQGQVKPVFFDYDKAVLSVLARSTLEANARVLQQFPDVGVIIEGHCDERGTEEYNLALGDQRAQVTRDYLVGLGVDSRRLESVSYGEEQPFSPGHDESSWRLNRRAHFVAKR
jgi:peptidoglycan-associated lipoprotein